MEQEKESYVKFNRMVKSLYFFILINLMTKEYAKGQLGNFSVPFKVALLDSENVDQSHQGLCQPVSSNHDILSQFQQKSEAL